jgi:hypothetical protein
LTSLGAIAEAMSQHHRYPEIALHFADVDADPKLETHSLTRIAPLTAAKRRQFSKRQSKK